MARFNQTLHVTAILVVQTIQVAAQPTVRFDQIGLNQGLSQSTVLAIVQDKQGFLWFGTQDGLNRYDGYTMKVFKHDPADSNSISDNVIWTLLCDSRGDLWIGTERGGLNRYVQAENKFYRYMRNGNDTNSLAENTVTLLYEDSRGTIWVGTRHKGLSVLNTSTGTFSRLRFDSGDLTISDGPMIREICEDKKRNLWVATRGHGLYVLALDSVNTSRITRYSHKATDPHSLSSDDVRALCYDRQGTLWVGTWGGGLNHFKPNEHTGHFTRYVHDARNQKSISNNMVTSIHEDSEGWLWVGTYDGGLNLYSRASDSFEKHLADENVMTIYEDRSGILYVGTLASGVRVFDRRKNRFTHYFDDPNDPDDLQGNKVQAILESKDGELWVATWGNSLNRFVDRDRKKVWHYSLGSKNQPGRGKHLFTSIRESSDGSIWVGAIRGGLMRLDKHSGQVTKFRHDPNNPHSIRSDDVTTLSYDEKSNILWIGYYSNVISALDLASNTFKHFLLTASTPAVTAVAAIERSRQQGIWIGTIRGGMLHLNPETNALHRYDATSFEHGRSINNNDVYSIYEDPAGIVWIGTAGGGLNRYDPTTGSFTYYTTQLGLPNDVIYGVLPDRAGNLWLSTNYGLSRFNPRTRKFKNFDVRDGLQSNEFNANAYFVSPRGELFFGGVNGFNAFFPEAIDDNVYVPPVYLTTFKVFNQQLSLPNPIPHGTVITLSHTQNFFSFEFVALNYTAPDKNRYAYMMEGFDKDWHEVPAQQRYASYTNLDPGEYTLRVKASNNDGVWNEAGTSITIIVTPPFWMTWWFRSVLTVVLAVAVGGAFKYYVTKKYKERMQEAERAAAVDRERLRIARDMHDDLGARLTEIRLLSEMAQHDSNGKIALRTISEAARDIIATFGEIVWSVNPQHDSVEHLAEYIGQYAVDYLSKVDIRCRLDLPQRFPSWKASSEMRHNMFLAVKESLNNAVKYSQTKEIHVKVDIEDSMIRVTIRDFGIGFDPEKERRGNGLQNMHQRMEHLGGTCTVESHPGSGTAVTFAVPVNV